MKQVLLILADQKLGKNLKNILADKFKLEVFLHSSASEAISFLEILPYSNLILIDESIGKESTGQKMYDFINQSKEVLPEDLKVIFLSNNLGKYPPYQLVAPLSELTFLSNLIAFELKLIDKMPMDKVDDVDKNEVHSTTEKNLENTPVINEATTVFQIPKSGLTASNINIKNIVNESLNSDVIEYFEIDIRLLKTKTEINFPCDCYTRVKKGEHFEYSKKIEKNSAFSSNEYSKLFNRGIKQLWINQNDYLKSFPVFTKIFTQNISDLTLSYSERLTITSDAYEIMLKLIKENKIDQNLVEIIKVTLPSYDFFTKIEDPISTFLSELKKSKHSFGLTHSTLTCLIMHRVFTQFEWSKDYTKNKINYVTFFHDLCIGSDKLIKLHHNFFEEKNNINPEDLMLIEKHADKIAKLLEKIVKAPKELVALLREHHGSINGIGINENLNLRIYPFTKLLIISEKIAFECLKMIELSSTKEIDMKDIKYILDENKPKFEKQGYAEIYKELEQSLNCPTLLGIK